MGKNFNSFDMNCKEKDALFLKTKKEPYGFRRTAQINVH